ncbi:alpha/beta fold hydrolase, partial [Azospirillum brasilense]|uniref:alpha/beta fold hydrolase n=1 Tax=Azospirillum brasilense TaxID=192 RepID=UPI00190E1B29
LAAIRDLGSSAAVVFIHGFTGHVSQTWGDFPRYLVDDVELAGWDVFAVAYPSSVGLDIPGLWAADPDISILANGLKTTLALPPLADRKALVILAHSMGGLVAQRAILDDSRVARRVQHLFLFGTPSGGLVKSRFGWWMKRQIRDMADNSDFILRLSNDRRAWFAGAAPFHLHAVAGNRDEFVPANSSLQPFPRSCWDVVDGNHLQIIKPDSSNHKSVALVKAALTGKGLAPSIVDGAMIAVEQRRFQDVVDTLLPRAASLDDRALVDLALALDGQGRSGEALALLEATNRSATDAMGVLAGRIKRRWLVERAVNDWQRARDLYAEGCARASAADDHHQAYYHGINVAFLDLMMVPEGHAIPNTIREMAITVLAHCDQANDTMWRRATEGEALLILGDLDEACVRYAWAVQRALSPRELASIYAHAVRVAEHIHGEDGGRKVAGLFAPHG